MKNSYYFSHDYHSRHDPKLSALIKEFGMTGYGVWWNLVEIMHEQGGRIEKFPKLFEGLARELNIDEAPLKQIISASIKDFNLLNEDDTHIWSDRVLRNMEDLHDKRMQKVTSGRLGGIASGIKRSKPKQNEAPLEANEQKESKVKESKVDSNLLLTNQVFKEAWNAWLEVRKKLRAPNTERALQLALKELEKHPIPTAIRMMEQSISRGWRGVFPLSKSKIEQPQRRIL